MELEEYSLNEEDYKFTEYEQYINYIEKGFHKLSVKEIKKFNAVSNKLLTSHGNLKKKYTNEDACKILEKFCDEIGFKDYYVY